VEIAAGDDRELAEALIALYGGRYHVQAAVPEVVRWRGRPSMIVHTTHRSPLC